MTPADLRKTIALQVKVTQVGYADAVATTANTIPVVPGTFLNTREPTVVGIAQVGVPLTADQGCLDAQGHGRLPVGRRRSRGARCDHEVVHPAAARTSASRSTVEILASRDGYLTALVPSQPTAVTLPGIIRATKVPVVTGKPMVGHTLHASAGSWSLAGVDPLLPVVRRHRAHQGCDRPVLPADG